MSPNLNNIPDFGSLAKGSRVVVFSGAGMSAESGLNTFRDSGGIWDKYSIYEVATPEAWRRDPERVQRFYNERRKQLLEVEPNAGHRCLAKLQDEYDVQVITQNIDDLHERAGSENVLHLHGELRKSRSSLDENLVYEIEGWELRMGECCERGSQLRPHVVWFGEVVPLIGRAMELIQSADFVIVVGSSLAVYPAAGLLHEVKKGVPVLAIDPGELDLYRFPQVMYLREKATSGLKKLVTKMLGS